MNLEFLANELLLDLFDYLHPIELLHAFYGLNIRFNNLLSLYLQTQCLDCRSISKHNFDYLCKTILPCISDQIISIHLSNGDDVPGELDQFFSYGFQFQHLHNLQTLSLSHIRSTELVNAILLDCPQLVSLNLIKCYFYDDIETSERCTNTIWNLSKLKSCYLDIEYWTYFKNSLPTRISSSLQTLSIENNYISLDNLISIFNSTPNLNNLTVEVSSSTTKNDQQVSFTIPRLKKLNMKFYESFHILSYFLKNLPNLSELIIETDEIWIDGYQWEDILMNYLKQLKIFHLVMFYQINSEKNIIDEITYLIESFQTTFWLNEYQKFIRCDYHSEHGRTCLYTLPYGFRKFKSDTCNMSISTYPKEKMSKAFHSVRSVVLSSVINEFASKTSVQLSNIQHLELYYPFDDKFWLVLTNFDRLRSLEIISIPFPSETDRHIDYVYSLIDRSKYLYSLSMDYLVLEELSTMSTPIKSIRRLNIMANDGHFYGSECISLIQSCFGNQCEILFINLENRTIALDIIHQMSYLRVLIFQCQDDQWEDNQETMSTTDELLPYFKQHLSSNCSILRDEHESNIIQLWIR